ncbi:cytochrome P450 [Nonomuraea thailandensis]|uniref:Cytochrome P450 n=1 Tax=Nonomuraea thailandensis TaxID=1188745 RepID=A0A9X2GG65_9ACTN|nr:cytochrome P450 [Nonomuraea thailandensis]MCP2357240.1 cytochrome P450 [Nonomuraea thailandensis]
MTGDDRFGQDVGQGRKDRLLGTSSEVVTDPVTDWASDFSHVDPVWVADPYPIQDELRRSCPIARTERFGGAWLPTRYEDVAAIAYDTERFSSRAVIVSNNKPPRELAPAGDAPPITSDPPFHREARRLLLPMFTRAVVAKQEEATRAYCHELIDAMRGRQVVDAARDYAQHIPMRVIADLLGFPPEDGPRFREFVENVLESIDQPPEERLGHQDELAAYLVTQIQGHLAEPRDDLTTYLVNAELDGRKLDPVHVVGTMMLLLIAGVDTTWSAIGASLWHLAATPADRERLAARPALLPVAIEEFLRAYAPVTMARLVKQDMHFNGVDMRADDWVLLSFPAANRDPARFERADEVLIDREENRHAAFGLGVHRCVGSHLARMELRVALEVWLERVPAFTLADPAAVTWAASQVRGPRTLPLRIL